MGTSGSAYRQAGAPGLWEVLQGLHWGLRGCLVVYFPLSLSALINVVLNLLSVVSPFFSLQEEKLRFPFPFIFVTQSSIRKRRVL